MSEANIVATDYLWNKLGRILDPLKGFYSGEFVRYLARVKLAKLIMRFGKEGKQEPVLEKKCKHCEKCKKGTKENHQFSTYEHPYQMKKEKGGE